MASAADHKPDPHSPPSLSSPDPSAAAPSAAVASHGDGAPESVAAAEAEGASAAPSGESAPEAEVEAAEEEEEEAECGFCLFMKGGGCKDAFVAWEKCVEDAERFGDDVVEKCFEATSVLKKCMDAHADYYAPILQAEQAMAVAVANEATDGSPKEENSISQSETKMEEKES